MNTNFSSQLNQCEQLVQQLIQQTSQASQVYEQLKQQEQQNAIQLEEIAAREKLAVQTIATALQGHQQAVDQMQQVVSICKQIEQSSLNSTFVANQTNQHLNGNLTN